MKSASRRLARIKALIIIALVSAFVAFYNFPAKYEKVSAASAGPSASRTNAPGENNCTACHSDFPLNSGTGNISISGVPANYLPNQPISITVRTSQEDAVIYGFQMTAIDSLGRKVGTYTIPAQTPAQLKTIEGIVGDNQREYIEHTVDGIIPTQPGSKSWTFTWNAPPQRVGKISFYAAGNAANSDANTTGDHIYTTSKSTLSGTAISNFDVDEKSDIAFFRSSTGFWYSQNSTNGGTQLVLFGSPGDKPVSADYDGDGRNDLAVFRSTTSVWYIQRSTGGAAQAFVFGQDGDVPVIGDYDGDGRADLAVFRPTTSVWYIRRSTDSVIEARVFGNFGDKIAQGDYDADGKTDLAVFRPTTSVWYIRRSTDNAVVSFVFGSNGDKAVQGDYDGDGRTDIAVFRPMTTLWYWRRSQDGEVVAVPFGNSADKPVPADYDGDGKTDVAIFRDGAWAIRRSSDNIVSFATFGAANDTPIPAVYIAE
jgi:hypothetical protein